MIKVSNRVNRILYATNLGLSGYFVGLAGDPMMAAACLGIALVFDPFDPHQRWNDRPLFQKVWLILHLTVVFLLFIYGLKKI